ncbi:hypothetical protein Glove_180g97 [Diversispora epigaea]|uniref:Myb-like domain-containing protein n=1 Tax=Diversispora epigaea TaxID=1348612 RepID=A0A397IQY0_9GLOM|nr:hypothetical protein Glove_180g97 [Diversispora epigaea]
MSQWDSTPKNKPQFTWSPEDVGRMNSIISEFMNSGIFEIKFKDIWSQFSADREIEYRRFVQKMCKKQSDNIIQK